MYVLGVCGEGGTGLMYIDTNRHMFGSVFKVLERGCMFRACMVGPSKNGKTLIASTPSLPCACVLFNPIAIGKTKIAYNFGLYECNRVKGNISFLCPLKNENFRYGFRKCNSSWGITYVTITS